MASSKLKSVVHRLEEICGVLKRHHSLIDSHMVNFFTHDLWQNNVPVNIRDEVKNIPLEEVLVEFWHPTNQPSDRTVKCVELNYFINQIRSMYLSSFDELMNVDRLQEVMSRLDCTNCAIKLDQSFMSLKKSHEVEVMSSIVASMSKALNCSHIVDVGGGKGYLSSVLCLEHKLKVLGLDSSSTNTHSATIRTQKMQKFWDGVQRRIKAGNDYNRRGKHWKAKSDGTDERLTNDNNTDGNFSKDENTNVVSGDSDIKTGIGEQNDTYRNNRLLLNENFKLATHYVNSNTRLYDVTRTYFPDDKVSKLAVIGLHTCGNLGSSCLRLFVEDTSNDQLQLLVNVGCCYHLLTEKYPRVPLLKHMAVGKCESSDNNCNIEKGFPLSEYLHSKRFSLSYNSRVLSSQSVERISETSMVPSNTLFYRALLELLIRRNVSEPDELNNGLYCVGHIKCKDFFDYVNKAIKKLRLNIQIHESEVWKLYEEYEQYMSQLYIYFMMRVTLAPLVEATILLDRLLYLYDNGIENAHLVKMFDPLLSPRCYGIVAFRKEFS